MARRPSHKVSYRPSSETLILRLVMRRSVRRGTTARRRSPSLSQKGTFLRQSRRACGTCQLSGEGYHRLRGRWMGSATDHQHGSARCRLPGAGSPRWLANGQQTLRGRHRTERMRTRQTDRGACSPSWRHRPAVTAARFQRFGRILATRHHEWYQTRSAIEPKVAKAGPHQD